MFHIKLFDMKFHISSEAACVIFEDLSLLSGTQIKVTMVATMPITSNVLSHDGRQ